MSDPTISEVEEQEAAALKARLTAREEKVAGLKASLSERKRALLGKLVQSGGAGGAGGAAGMGGTPSRAMIPRRTGTGPAVLSFAQERLWFLDRLEPESPFYNLPTALRLSGRLDLVALDRSIGEIVRRHEALRTTFEVVAEGEPRQVVHPAPAVSVPVVDLSGLAVSGREEEARRLAVFEALRPFDLQAGPLLRTTLLRLAETASLALFNLHHIVGDGWSIGVLVNELAALYRAFARGDSPALPELPIQYADYANWHREWLAGEVLAAELAHWRRELDGAPDLLALPTDRPRPLAQSFRGAEVQLTLERPLAAALGALAESEGATLFMVLLAGFEALLGRWTGQEDLLVGSAVANRARRETEGLIGFFINLLVLRGRLAGAPSFRELVGRARTTALAAYAHQDLPFEKLVSELRLARSRNHNPLVQAVFVLQNAPRGALELPGLTLSLLDLPATTAKFDLELAVTATGSELFCQLEYATDLFDRSTILRLAGHFGTLLAAALASPETPVLALPLLGAAETHQLRSEWNAGPKVASGGTVQERFAAHAALRPDVPALVFDGAVLSYGELARRASRVARFLVGRGVRPGRLVGLCLDRSLKLGVAVLGVLRAGAAYVPLDPGHPAERLGFVLADSGMCLLLTTATAAASLPALPPDRAADLAIVDLEAALRETPETSETPETPETPETSSGRPLPPHTGPEDLAYVIYTSGSTGRPKGVGVRHGEVSRLLAATEPEFGFGPEDTWTLFHSYAFDFSVWELWGALAYGGRLVVVPYWTSRSPEEFRALLWRERVTVLNQTPSAFRPLIRAEEEALARSDGERSLRWVIFGGEALQIQDLSPWWERHGDLRPRLVNMYGITETTVHVTCRALGRRDLEDPGALGARSAGRSRTSLSTCWTVAASGFPWG